MNLFFKMTSGKTVVIDIDEKETNNPVGSIIPRILLKSELEHDPEHNDYRIILMGQVVAEDRLIADFVSEASSVATIHFIVTPKPEQNKWQALYLDKFTSIPAAIINIITSYSAERPSRSRFLGTLNYALIDNTKAGLSILFKVFRSKFSQYSDRMTATQLLQQLHDSEIQHILDAKGNLTTLAQQLTTRLSANNIQPGSEQDVKQLTDDAFSLVSSGVIPNTPSTESAPSSNEESTVASGFSIS